MSQNIVLKKGLNIPIAGAADPALKGTVTPSVVAIQPSDFKGLTPRLLVKEGDHVLAGSPVLADKMHTDIILTSPVSGTVKEVVRGEKRKLLAVLIEAEKEQEYVDFGKVKADSAEAVKEALLASGLWPFFVQRPYGILADPKASPKAIFVSAFDTAPLAADAQFCYADAVADIQCGIDALSKIATVNVGLNADLTSDIFAGLSGCTLHKFSGSKHPAGNVGVQISHICPIRKEEVVWTISLLGLSAIGKLFGKGRLDLSRKVAVCGPASKGASYISTLPGMPMAEVEGFCACPVEEVRFISGDVLSGVNAGKGGYLGFRSSQITLIREGVEKELLGWINPIRCKQYSHDHSYFSWLMPSRKYNMDTNLHGGPRAFLMNDGYYSKVLPMDIYPVFLAKACLAGDIDKMEQFGIYEVLPEDLATCEFVDPSKNNIQEMIAKGIDLMLKEMA